MSTEKQHRFKAGSKALVHPEIHHRVVAGIRHRQPMRRRPQELVVRKVVEGFSVLARHGVLGYLDGVEGKPADGVRDHHHDHHLHHLKWNNINAFSYIVDILYLMVRTTSHRH